MNWWTEAAELAAEKQQLQAQEAASSDTGAEAAEPLTMRQYAAMRQNSGMDNVGRAPGHERAEFMGHRLEDGHGFADWRDYGSNERVFESQLADNRRPMPPG